MNDRELFVKWLDGEIKWYEGAQKRTKDEKRLLLLRGHLDELRQVKNYAKSILLVKE